MTARAEIVTASDGSRWRLRCRCGAHPSKGHDARPETEATDDRLLAGARLVAEDRRRLYGTPIPGEARLMGSEPHRTIGLLRRPLHASPVKPRPVAAPGGCALSTGRPMADRGDGSVSITIGPPTAPAA